MEANDLKTLLNVIDDRVAKKINETKFLKKYTGSVVKSIDSSKSVVKLAGEETEFVFPNKTGKLLNIGDNVYIETLGTDLNTGIISEKFGFDDLTSTSIMKDEVIKLKTYLTNNNSEEIKELVTQWNTFNFVNGLNFCWRKILIDKDEVASIQNSGFVYDKIQFNDENGTIFFSEDLPFEFTEEPFIFFQGIENSANFSAPISCNLITKTTSVNDKEITKFTGIEGCLYLKDKSKVKHSVNIFVIGKV